MKKRLLAFAAAVLCGLLLLTGCSGGDTVEKKAPGRLCGVTYTYVNGSAYGRDFHIELTPEQVVEARYFTWTEGEGNRQFEVAGAPVTEEVWNEVEALVQELYPQLTPARKTGWLHRLLNRHVYIASDKGSEKLILMWETDSGIQPVQYTRCFADAETQLLELLKTIARDCPVPETEE